MKVTENMAASLPSPTRGRTNERLGNNNGRAFSLDMGGFDRSMSITNTKAGDELGRPKLPEGMLTGQKFR